MHDVLWNRCLCVIDKGWFRTNEMVMMGSIPHYHSSVTSVCFLLTQGIEQHRS